MVGEPGTSLVHNAASLAAHLGVFPTITGDGQGRATFE
jgi:hypothetical protein